jgi:hypothetical protein
MILETLLGSKKMKKGFKLLGIALMFLSLRIVYTLVQGTRMLLTFSSFYTSRNLDLAIIQFLDKNLPLTYSVSIFFLSSSLLLIATIYYLSESIGLNSELGFYTTFIYATSVPTYVFLSNTPLVYDSISLVFFVVMLYSLEKMELQKDKNMLNILNFTVSWGIATFLSNVLVQTLTFVLLATTTLMSFHKSTPSLKNKLVTAFPFVITAYLVLERNLNYFYAALFSILLFIAFYLLFNKKVRTRIAQQLVTIQDKLIVLKKPSILLLIFIVAASSSIFFSNIEKSILCIVVSLVINAYFFVIGFFFNKSTNKTIPFFIVLMLLIYFVSLGFNFAIPLDYFVNYLVLVSSPISGAGLQELVEKSNIADRYIFTYIISYFSILLLAIPLLVF